ncbi:G-type lectin S-receptor-like serine/threonine-protein kinase LECRK1 [Durio zibethinus]|uniref:Receptor-like serine/threonine-protein kinase n=1 Tax=Durio zibethinus TaxID=66656 RepID=A0A6P6B5B9_DURZI|nr:G-type lectin S-receptor-like serine/threonine-protein kinase LECRK1 [Durio zibethinus]
MHSNNKDDLPFFITRREEELKVSIIQKMAFMILFLLLLLLSCILSTANAQPRNSSISPGSSLSPNNNSYWLSESGQFAFGFYPYGNGFSVGIWFENIQQKTVVWTANRDDPPFPSDVQLLLSTQGRLIVRSKEGQDLVIANTSDQLASSAAMLDSGNFVLFNWSSGIIWQTFDFPTDTILPNQRLVPPNKLVSNVSETNHTSGKFVIVMQTDGNLVQYHVEEANANTAYWYTKTYEAGNGVTLNFNIHGQLYLLNASGSNIKNISDKASVLKAAYRATIDADGIFRLYSHTLNQSDNWSIEWSSLDDKCSPTGLCGLNSYCNLIYSDPVCQCPSGFDYIDRSQKNLGCRRNSSVDACTTKGEPSFDVHELIDVLWYADAYSTLSSIEKNACKEECFRDCNCEAALYENGNCKKLKLPLRFGKRKSTIGATSFLKIGAQRGKRKRRELRMDIFISSIACSTLSFLVLAAAGVLIHRSRIRKYKRIVNMGNVGFVEDVTLRSFTYNELKVATNNFKDELGKGAYGTVFRGVISKGKRVVAIKRLEKVVDEGERDFRNEMKAIGKTHHKNLVQLLGYCYDGTNRLLVYEYMKNGSLADFLFKSKLRVNWEGRIEIVLNIAGGIFYLHEECETQIIHCDIKPENILMDDKGYAKIADFGLAKLLMPSQTRTYTGIRGTRGYVAPEWHSNLPITVKVDVYSFGIMLFEIICCRRKVEADVPENEAVLANWVYDCFKANELEKLVRNEEVERCKIERMVKVGLWCAQDEPSSRPSMKKVMLMLEGTVNVPDPPLLSSFVSSP